MGAPMAHRLITAGHELSVWNRTEGRTEPLLREGAIAAGTPAEAELGADAVFTMLLDDAANEEVLLGANGLARMPFLLAVSTSRAAPSASRSASASPRSTRAAALILSPPLSSAVPTSLKKSAACGSSAAGSRDSRNRKSTPSA